MREGLHRIDLTVSIWVDTEDIQDVLENLDYEVKHPAIRDMELTDANWE